MKSLVDGCLEVIAEDAVNALQTYDFCSIDVETLCLVLERSDLIISEIELFEAVIRWSKKACEKADLPINPGNQRKVLKDSPLLLRFPVMKLEDFASKVVDSGILSKAEIISAFRSFTLKHKKYISLFSEIPRGRPFTASRFKLETSGETSFGSSDGTDWSGLLINYCKFSANRDIHLTGIGLYGSPNHTVSYTVDITVTGYTRNPNYNSHSNQQYLLSPTLMHNCGIYDCNSDKIYRIMFKNPIAVTATTKYFIEVKILGKFYVYGCGGSNSLEVNNDPEKKVVFTFESKETVESELHRGIMTDVNSGQIPEFLFEV